MKDVSVCYMNVLHHGKELTNHQMLLKAYSASMLLHLMTRSFTLKSILICCFKMLNFTS